MNINFSQNSRRVAVGTATWDYRFPYFLVSFGSPRSSQYFPHNSWMRFDAKAIAALAASTVGTTSGANVEAILPMDVSGGNAGERSRIYYLSRSATEGIIIASADSNEDCYPLRIRGSA